MRIIKTFLSMSVLLLVIVISSCLFSCDSNLNSSESELNDGDHIHSFTAWITTTMPSCTVAGSQTRTCNSCGFSEYSPIPPFGHSEITDPAIIATCTTDGKTEGKHCSVCNEVLVVPTIIPSSGHQYNDAIITTQATCRQDGVKQYTCSVSNCNHSYTESYKLPTYTATEIYNQSIKYVGEIITYNKKGEELSLATGFVISSDGKIVTNYHVIEGAYSADITINNKKYNIVSVLAYDTNIDLAVLKINATGLTPATICKKTVDAGSTVYAIGSSSGMTNTYSQGIITYADRIVDGVSHVQHDASITHGNSGGPLINVYGEVIGINTWGISDSQNLNFAVFADELDNLEYNRPIPLSELFQKKLTPYEYLINWVLNNYNETYFDGKVVSAEENSGNFIYSISYNLMDSILYIDVYDNEMYFSINLAGVPTKYEYYFGYEDNIFVRGTINANTFTENTILKNYEYDGDSYFEESSIKLTQSAMCSTLSFFDYYLAINNLGLSIEDFGFSSFNTKDDTHSNNSTNNTDSVQKEWFISQFNIATSEYIEFLNESKRQKNNQINELQAQAGQLYADYQQERQRINEYCAANGLSNSGYHKSMLDNAEANYKSSAEAYSKQIDDLNEDISIIDTEISNPSVNNILKILSENCNISEIQAQQYYIKYMSE